MVSLHLKAPSDGEIGNEEDGAERRKLWLDDIGALVQRVLGGGEPRLWLITDLSSLEVPADIQADCFVDLLQNMMRNAKQNGEDGHGTFELQLMRMICEKKPRIAAKLIMDDKKIIKDFFAEQPKRILHWFDKFAGAGQSEHQQGARALANYAFRNRDVCWHLLAWEGKHAQAPATVAAKPHYFLELDVVDTILNFLEEEPEFWRSFELKDCLKDGEFLSIDVAYFAQHLVKELSGDKEYSTETWIVVKDYLKEESFSVLCQQLLHAVTDNNLLKFLNNLGSELSYNCDRYRNHQRDRLSSNADRKPRSFLEVLAIAGLKWKGLDEVLFCNACMSHSRKLWRIFQEEEHEEDTSALKKLMDMRYDEEGRDYWALRLKSVSMGKTLACRYVALEGWVLFHRLCVDTVTISSLESLLVESSIKFQRCSLPSEDVEAKHKKRKRKSGKHTRNKKHRKRDLSDSGDDHETSWSNLEYADKKGTSSDQYSWRLSIDDFSLIWTKVLNVKQQWDADMWLNKSGTCKSELAQRELCIGSNHAGFIQQHQQGGLCGLKEGAPGHVLDLGLRMQGSCLATVVHKGPTPNET